MYMKQYVTNSELGFDYLRDNLALTPADIVLGRPLNMCIVDEADSIMIDEARTPLIISEKTAAPVAKYANSAKIAAVLQEKVHYTVDERSQSVVLTERGFADVEKILNVEDLFNPRDPWSTYIINALKAKSLFKKDVQVPKRMQPIPMFNPFHVKLEVAMRLACLCLLQASIARTIPGTPYVHTGRVGSTSFVCVVAR
jgi:preprotein translocase subunit SecA